MLYSELLAQQDREASKLNFEYRESRDQLKRMQKEHFDGDNKYAPEFERLEQAYLRDRDALDKRHRQEQKDFLNEPEREKESVKSKDMDTAYDKLVNVKIDGLKEETREERLDRKMREWDEEQLEKTRQRELSRERGGYDR
ncbi:MAG: hypothetical protein BGO21_08625 [Dyadobacter sp. 50-39]|uniref:hypothetical protein n=1 Tax=Dyadobacter sp. 50-39 TaxID=1895756 RepID=UPI00095EDFAA|nr:hypothetical protein [Dyadobacter sp. 50-39]OJV19311.1 MAG: hypothetical protein BGO21_08625 [Dyadobacter sp. 50-39]